MPIGTRDLADLVTVMLSVNNHPWERAAALMPAFEAAGLLDPSGVMALEVDDLKRRMEAAGYHRGGYLPIMAGRMYTLMTAARDGRLDALPAAVAANDEAAFVATLSAVYGWGPRTAADAFARWRSR